ncbi:MAG TPA: MFS transporter [Steroidobacteraceae bacterium]|jgi:oligogalacturonide transporter|nr:MFS transporter [Steroidobacteraceae bacterium]
MSTRQVKFGHYLAYGSNDVLGAGVMFVMSAWTLYFFTTFCGLTAGEAGIIFISARLLDAFFSPVIGYVSDRFHRTRLGQRFGRRRFFILLAVPLLPSFALMWMDGHGFWYYLVTYVFFELVYAMEIIPYETLAAEMSPDYKVKAKFAGARILTGQVSAILAGILPGRIIEHFGKSSAETFLYLGIVFAALSSFVALMVYLFTWERPRAEIESLAPTDSGSPLQAVLQLFKDLWATLRIRAFRLHLGMYVGGYISQDIFNAAFTYFATLALAGTVVTVSNYLGWMVGAQLVSVALAIPLCLRFHPAPIYRIAVSFFAVAVIGLLLLWNAGVGGQSPWIYAMVLLAGLGRGALNYIPWSVYNYMADVDEIVTGRRREGSFAGVMTFLRKLLQTVAVLIVTQIFNFAGLVPNSRTQSPEFVRVVVMVMVAGSLGVLLFGFLVSLRFRLNRETHAVLMAEIERFKTQPGTEPTPESRAIVEDLSGWKYQNLWGKGRR